MIVEGLEDVRKVEMVEMEAIRQDEEVSSAPIKTVGTSRFVLGRPYWYEHCVVKIEDEGEVFAQVDGRSLTPHLYIKEEGTIVRAGEDPMISLSPKMDWPDISKKVRDDDDYESDEANTERQIWKAVLGGRPEKYDYLICLN